MAEIGRQLDKIYSLRRDNAIRELENRRREAYRLIPSLPALLKDIAMAGIRHAKAVMKEGAETPSSEDLDRTLMALERKKEQLLSLAGFPADWLEPRYTCERCRDTGILLSSETGLSQPCSCYRQLYVEKLFELSNILDDGQTGFSYFRDSYYPDISDKKRYRSDLSPREQILLIKEKCLDFVDHFEEASLQNLFFTGSPGTGKTFMARCIGLELLKKGYTVLYLSTPSLFEIIRKYRMNQEEDGLSFETAYRSIATSQLLILDDLGTEPLTESRYAELLTLLETRKALSSRSVCRTVISSNLDAKGLFEVYKERIASRILGEFTTLQFIGEDIRLIKKLG